MEFPTLQTDRLILREWNDDDKDNLFAIFSNESVVRYTATPLYQSPADSVYRIEGSRKFFHEKNLGITWGIFEKSSGRVLGDIDFTYKERDNFRVMLGCCFAPEAWGKGYASEALQEVIRYGFEDFPEYKVNRIQAETDPRNAAAIKLLTRCGFKNEALLREYGFERGEFVDQHVFGLLRREYK